MKFRFRFLALSLLVLAVGGLTLSSFMRITAVSAQNTTQDAKGAKQPAFKSFKPVAFGITPRLSEVPERKAKVLTTDILRGTSAERLIRKVPNRELNKEKGDYAVSDGALITPDDTKARRTTTGRAVESTAPVPSGVNFEGLRSTDNIPILGGQVLPPDTIGDVGPTQYVQAVNSVFRVYSKTGTPLTPVRSLGSLFASIGGPCAANDGDPTVNYDALADRWVITQFGVPDPFFQCVAISQTGDATGPYYAYQFNAGGNNLFNDYPKFGVWPDAYYQTTNQFEGGVTFADAGVYAYDRRRMLAGDPNATFIFFNTSELFPGQGIGGVLPSTIDNSTAPPPPGRPNTFAYFTADEFGDPQGDALRLFDFRANFDNPAASSFTERAESPVRVAAFNPLTPTGRNDVEQPTPAPVNTYLDTIGDRIVHRLQYRNFGTALAPDETLVVNQTVNVGTGNTVATHQAAPRYYQLRAVGGTGQFVVQNQGTFVPEGIEPTATTVPNRWMGSVALDNDGNLALGYSVSSLSIFPSIRVTGRLATDPPNTLQPEVSMIEGSGRQTSTSGRWGDYSSMNVDPVDDCTFWYTQEYYQTTSAANWQTRIANFRYPSCTAPEQGTLQVNVTECNSGQALQGASVTINGNLYGTTEVGDGSFSTQLAPGTYTVVIRRPSAGAFGGEETITRTVTITNGGTATINGVCFTGIAQPVAAGVTLVDESCPPANGVIDPGERVTVNLQVRNTGTTSTTNLVGTLQASANVVAPRNPENFGVIAPGGSATRSFEFTAAGNCGDTITLTLQLQDGTSNFGTVTYTVTLGGTLQTAPVTFTNSTPIVIPGVPTPTPSPTPSAGPANPYPSNITVAGVTGTVSTVSVTLNGFNHTFPDDVDILLVGPGGQRFIIMSDAGGGADAVNANITLSDAATNLLPDSTVITSGTFRPTNYGTGDTFPAPAPAGPYASPAPAGTATFASTFGGTQANGTWSLYVVDAFAGDVGTISGGWTLTITPQVPSCESTCGTARLTTTATFARSGANVTATISVRNEGTATATGVTINTASLGAAATGTPLPVNLGNIAPGQTATATVTFANPGAAGTRVPFRIRGTYNGGSLFTASYGVTLP